MPADSPFMNAKITAAYLGVTRDTFYRSHARWTKLYGFPPKNPATNLWDRGAIDAWRQTFWPRDPRDHRPRVPMPPGVSIREVRGR